MSNPFAKATTATKSLQSDVRTGGVPASNEYEVTIRAAYLLPNVWDDKDHDMHFHVEMPSGFEHKFALKVLQNGSPMTKDKSGKEVLLWTAEKAARLVGVATDGSTLEDIYGNMANKQVDRYDFDEKKEVAQSVPTFMDLIGKKVVLGLQRKVTNKKTKEGDEWVDLAEKKETLELATCASASTRLTWTEMLDGVKPEDASEMDAWTTRNKGKDWNAYKEVGSIVQGGVPEGAGAEASTKVVEF